MSGVSRNKRTEEKREERKTTTEGMLKDLHYFDNPQNDDELLLNYQYDYLINHSEKAWADLWTYSLKVAGQTLAHICKKRRLQFSSEEWEDKKIEAVTYVLRRYKTKDGYYIKNDFPLHLWYGVKHALDYRTKADILLDNTYKALNTGSIKIE